jgi:hypothetical protein
MPKAKKIEEKVVLLPKLVKVRVLTGFNLGWNVGDEVEIPKGLELDKLIKEEKVEEVK